MSYVKRARRKSGESPWLRAIASMTRRRYLPTFVAALALLGVLAAGAVWWLDRPQTLLQAARYAATQSADQVSFEGLSGTLLRRIHADRVLWKDGEQRVLLEDVTLHWSPAWLLLATASFHDVHIGNGVVTLPPGSDTPLAPPASLRLPLRVR